MNGVERKWKHGIFCQEKEKRYEVATKKDGRVNKKSIHTLTIKYLGRKIVISFDNLINWYKLLSIY